VPRPVPLGSDDPTVSLTGTEGHNRRLSRVLVALYLLDPLIGLSGWLGIRYTIGIGRQQARQARFDSSNEVGITK
jgi:hypothetical protein